MLDSSGSMTMNLELLKQAAEQFVIRLLPEDRGRIGYFNDKIAFLSDFSNDRDMLIASIKDMQFGNPTRLFDSVLFSLDELKNVEGRKVILEFTDGADTASRGGLGEVLRRAREEEVMIYGIGLQSVMMGMRTKPDGALRKMAEETGGGYFELKDTDDLGPDLHPRRAGAAQPVPARLRAPDRRQGAQDRGPRQPPRPRGPRPQESYQAPKA